MHDTLGTVMVFADATNIDLGKILKGILALTMIAVAIAFAGFSIKHMAKVDLRSFVVMFIMVVGVGWMVNEYSSAGDIGQSTIDNLNKSGGK